MTKERYRKIASEHGISNKIADEVFANKNQFSNEQLIQIVMRLEKLNEDAANIAADIKEVMSEAKSAGFDPKYIRQMIRLRKMDPDELDETDELTSMYRKAVGI